MGWKRIDNERFNELVGEKLYPEIEDILNSVLVVSELSDMKSEFCEYHYNYDSYENDDNIINNENRCSLSIMEDNKGDENICLVIVTNSKDKSVLDFIVNLNGSKKISKFEKHSHININTKELENARIKDTIQWRAKDMKNIKKLIDLTFKILTEI